MDTLTHRCGQKQNTQIAPVSNTQSPNTRTPMDSSTHPLELCSAFLTHTGIPSSMLIHAVTVPQRYCQAHTYIQTDSCAHVGTESHTCLYSQSDPQGTRHQRAVPLSLCGGTVQGCHRSTEVHTRIHTRGKLGPSACSFCFETWSH